MTLTLFQRYPTLRDQTPHTPLGRYPTPVERLALPTGDVWIKRDDQTGALYGGNKVRKLEFLLGQTRKARKTHVWTLGAIGSHHALATALYAKQLGLTAHILHVAQPVTTHVQHNLRAVAATGAQLTLAPSNLALAGQFAWFSAKYALRAHAIPLGGTTPLSTLGYVNAALELAQQIADNQLPAPERIYVPVGTCGTLAGLWLGCHLAQLDTEVIGVRVVPIISGNTFLTARLIRKTSALLTCLDPSIPRVRPRPRDITIRHGHYGDGYGHPTAGGKRAIDLFANAGLTLDPTYTGKTASSLLNDLKHGDGPTLLWNTLSSTPLPALAAPKTLPEPYQRFFTP